MSVPIIRSQGPPPEQHADRVVAEMLRLIVTTRAERWQQLFAVKASSSDGSPRAQSRLVKKLKSAGGEFVLRVELEPGTRGRYRLNLFIIDGYDATRRDAILPGDTIPEKPWLACGRIEWTGRGRKTDASYSLFVSHHALSRLAQRCGAREASDLMAAVHNIWWAYLREIYERRDTPGWKIADGYRLKFALDNTSSAFAIMTPYDDGLGGLVVATIVDTM